MLSWPLAAVLQQSFAWPGLYSLLPHATFQFPTKTEAFVLAIAISTFPKEIARIIYFFRRRDPLKTLKAQYRPRTTGSKNPENSFQQEANLYLAVIISLGRLSNCFDNLKLHSFFQAFSLNLARLIFQSPLCCTPNQPNHRNRGQNANHTQNPGLR